MYKHFPERIRQTNETDITRFTVLDYRLLNFKTSVETLYILFK